MRSIQVYDGDGARPEPPSVVMHASPFSLTFPAFTYGINLKRQTTSACVMVATITCNSQDDAKHLARAIGVRRGALSSLTIMTRLRDANLWDMKTISMKKLFRVCSRKTKLYVTYDSR